MRKLYFVIVCFTVLLSRGEMSASTGQTQHTYTYVDTVIFPNGQRVGRAFNAQAGIGVIIRKDINADSFFVDTTAFQTVKVTTLVTRPVNSTTYTISTNKVAEADYYISIDCTASIGSNASGQVEFQYSTNAGSTWTAVGRVKNSNTVTLAIALNSVTNNTGVIHAKGIPANALCRMVSTTTGTTNITYIYGFETY